MAVANKILVIVACSFYLLNGQAHAQVGYDETRGELLYSIHCVSCHDAEVHWRDKQLATDWPSLTGQVKRWQNNLELNWNQSDITDVTGYLNAVYYHFPVRLNNGLSENEPLLSNPAH